MGKRKQLALKVSITYSPAPDYRERLRKVMGLLLRPSKENDKITAKTGKPPNGRDQ